MPHLLLLALDPLWHPFQEVLLLLNAEAAAPDQLGESVSWLSGLKHSLCASIQFQNWALDIIPRYLDIGTIAKYRLNLLPLPIWRCFSIAQASLQICRPQASLGTKATVNLDALTWRENIHNSKEGSPWGFMISPKNSGLTRPVMPGRPGYGPTK